MKFFNNITSRIDQNIFHDFCESMIHSLWDYVVRGVNLESAPVALTRLLYCKTITIWTDN